MAMIRKSRVGIQTQVDGQDQHNDGHDHHDDHDYHDDHDDKGRVEDGLEKYIVKGQFEDHEAILVGGLISR